MTTIKPRLTRRQRKRLLRRWKESQRGPGDEPTEEEVIHGRPGGQEPQGVIYFHGKTKP